MEVLLTSSKVEVMEEEMQDTGTVLEVAPDGSLMGMLYKKGEEDPVAKEVLDEEVCYCVSVNLCVGAGRELSRGEIAELAVSTLEHHLETSRADVLKMVELQGRE